MKRMAYRGWKNARRLANRRIELVVTCDVGPRIIRFGFVGGENEFKEFPATLGQRGGQRWRNYGGHRLWHAPEAQPRTYEPDNAPVAAEDHGAFARFVAPPERLARIQKEMDVRLDRSAAGVTVTHRLRNMGLWGVELAPWAISVMAPGGTAVFPLPKRVPFPQQLVPAGPVVLWSYVDMGDPRFTWGRRFVMLRQDPLASGPQKIGAPVPGGWAAYANRGRLFLKRFAYVPGARYPDFGCNFETFTNRDMLEMESLGPLVTLPPGAAVEHVERWELYHGVPSPKHDADVARHIAPLGKRRGM